MIDAGEFRRAMSQFATGVTVISTCHEDRPHGMTANAFLSASLEPRLVVVAVHRDAETHGRIAKCGRFGVSMLAEDQEEVCRYYARKPGEKTGETPYCWMEGVPLVPGALTHVIARVVDAFPAGDHTLFLGEVEYLDRREGRPLLYYRGGFHQLADP
jgi:flavin reductase (DIM6/NTAB) family NADH-FMN oxidoreductase RutF